MRASSSVLEPAIQDIADLWSERVGDVWAEYKFDDKRLRLGFSALSTGSL